MKKSLFKLLLIPVLPLVVFIGCKKPEISYPTEWIFPIVKTNILAEQISQLENLSFDTEATANDLVIAGGIGSSASAPMPAITSGVNMGPILMEEEDNYYNWAISDTTRIKVRIDNNFPVNIKAGTIIKIRNRPVDDPNQTLIFQAEVLKDIPAGGFDTLSVYSSTRTAKIYNDLNLFIENYRSDGSPNTAVSWAGASIKVTFILVVFHLNEAEVNNNKHYELTDTSDFNFSGNPTLNSINRGKITLYLRNGLPISYKIQAYFLDSNNVLVDSLFKTTQVTTPTVKPDGNVDFSTVKEDVLETVWTAASMERLQKLGKRVYLKADFRTGTTPAVVYLRHENQIGFHIVADVSVQVKSKSE